MQNKIIFLIIVQFISLLGTHISDFALGLYLYEKSESLYFYSYFSLVIILPGMLLGLVLGHYIDKFNKKMMMLLGHTGAGLSSITILILLINNYENFYVYLVLVLITSLFNSLVFASFNVLIGGEVEKKYMQRVSSLLQLGFGIAIILSPALGAYILDNYSIEIVFYIDISTFSLAFFVILFMTFLTVDTNKENENTRFIQGIRQSYLYLKENKLLYLSLILFAIANFSMAQVSVLITPIILDITTKSIFGIVMSISGIGMLLASVFTFVINLKDNLFWINTFFMLQALVLSFAIFEVDIVAITLVSFSFTFISSVIGILNLTYWQQEVHQKIKGKLFGLRKSIMLFSISLGYLLSVPLADFMQYLLEVFPSLYTAMGSEVHPEIRLLFIINAFIIIWVVTVINKQQKSIK